MHRRRSALALWALHPRAYGVVMAVASIAAWSLADPVTALARAGGGSGGSGGGGGSHGSSGGSWHSGGIQYSSASSGSGGGPTGWAALLITILVFGGFFGIVWLVVRSGGGLAASSAPMAASQMPPASTLARAVSPGGAPVARADDSLAAIQAVDPGFNMARFLDRCQAAFFLLQKAWMDRNLDEGRAYMSSGLYASWSVQVQGMIARHERDVLDGLYVRSMQPVHVGHDDNFDTITVRIAAQCSDYIVNDQTNKRISGSKRPEDWVELWTFQRSAGAKTVVAGGIAEQKCPNCGAPLQVNENGSCAYCHAPVTSGRFDWVLTRIDQV